MYKHTNKGEGIVTLSDDEGNQHTFFPGTTITLGRIYPELEKYEVVCINKDAEQIEIKEEKPKLKKKLIGDD